MEESDKDIEAMTVEQLRSEVSKLRSGIRRHRDCSAHDLCWFHPELWTLLPEKTDPVPAVPPLTEFITNCLKYHLSFDEKKQP